MNKVLDRTKYKGKGRPRKEDYVITGHYHSLEIPRELFLSREEEQTLGCDCHPVGKLPAAVHHSECPIEKRRPKAHILNDPVWDCVMILGGVAFVGWIVFRAWLG